MRFFALAFVISVAACDSSNNKNNVSQDMAMPGSGDDMAVAGDMAIAIVNLDASTPDLSPLTPSQQIQQVRNAADQGNTPDMGMLAMALPVEDVYVTYLKPNVPGQMFDPPGFFVQADPTGPALFVQINPASLSPVPQVGDTVSFTVIGVAKSSGIHEVTQMKDFAVTANGFDLTPFVQDLSSATDLVSGLNNYESELSKVDATLTSYMTTASPGYVAATIDTAGVAGSTHLKLRVPQGVRDALDLTSGCSVTVGPTPIWRFSTMTSDTAEPSGWVNADVVVHSCPGPQVVSARASDNTTVIVTFDRQIKDTTAVITALHIDNGLGVSAVSVSGNVVTLTTDPQAGGTLYTITVDSTVTDIPGTGVGAAHNSAQFHGFDQAAVLMITEFSPGISNNHDLLELYAVSGGNVAGYTLQQDMLAPKLLATLPDQYVADGDVIVLHITPTPSPTPTPTNEIVNIDDCTALGCYANAWDANGVSDIGNSARVLTIRDANGAIQDGLAFYDGKTMDADGQFFMEVSALVAANQWHCAAAACAITDVLSSKSTGNTPTGKSLQRKAGPPDTDNASDWNAPAASTYGTVP